MREVCDERLNDRMPQIFSRTDVIKVFAREQMKAWSIPIFADQFVFSKLITVPGREYEITWSILKDLR